MCLSVWYLKCSDVSASFCHSHNGRLFPKTKPTRTITAKISFVHLYNTKHFPFALFHCLSNSHIHVPSSLLGYSNLLGKVDGRNTWFRSCEKVDSDKPFL